MWFNKKKNDEEYYIEGQIVKTGKYKVFKLTKYYIEQYEEMFDIIKNIKLPKLKNKEYDFIIKVIKKTVNKEIYTYHDFYLKINDDVKREESEVNKLSDEIKSMEKEDLATSFCHSRTKPALNFPTVRTKT